MTDAQIQQLAEAMANMLLSQAAHGLATGSLEGTGEITLRDGLIVASAAEGARTRQAWVIAREVVPQGWTDLPVDLVIQRIGHGHNLHTIGGVELKWWRKTDASNSANRRRDLIRDFVRAASLYFQVDHFSFVALLSTDASWAATTSATRSSDSDAISKLSSTGAQQWNVRRMINSKGLQGALRSLRGKVPVPNIFHTELLCTSSLALDSKQVAFAKIWKVKKPQNTVTLDVAALDQLLPEKKPKRPAEVLEEEP